MFLLSSFNPPPSSPLSRHFKDPINPPPSSPIPHTFKMDSNADTIEQLRLALEHERRGRQEAEKKVQEADKKVQEADKKVQEAEDKTRGLSWREALSVWHNLFSKPIIKYRYPIIQPNAFTSAKGRRHPAQLVHWTNFDREHETAFTNLCNQFGQPEVEAFGSYEVYKENASTFMKDCVLNDEVDLVAYEERTVEELVNIAWQKKGGADRIGFKRREDHALDNIAPRLEQMNIGTKPKAKTPTTHEKSRRLYDKVCYVKVGQDQRRNLFVIEYKSAGKLTPALVKEGMHDMSIDTIIQRVTIPTDEDEKRKEKAEDSLAIILTQTFDYMIDLGLSYGYVNSGKTFIFLFVCPEKPQTLLYETVIVEDPIKDLSTTSSSLLLEQFSDEQLRLTAVGLVAGFALMALSKEPLCEACRSNARNELGIWQFGKFLAGVTSSEESTNEDSEGSSDFKEPDEYHTFPDTSPRQTRSKAKAKKDLARCQKGDTVLPRLRKDDDDASGMGDQTRLGVTKSGSIQSSSKSGLKTTTESNKKRGSSSIKAQNEVAVNSLQICKYYEAIRAMPDRPYCTQACLLGLIRGHTLDKQCPNVQAHQKGGQYYSRNSINGKITNGKLKSRQQCNNRHAIDQPALAQLIEEQLRRPERNYDGGFKSLDRSGWAGALFRFELLSHGYTFVGKGTVEPLVPVLEFEADMYKRMNTIQGKTIPVYLCSINLKSAFHLTTRTAIVHLMLLSWGGEEAWRCGIEEERLRLEAIRSYQEVAAQGVLQGDLRPPNILWNTELDRAILIDFEFAQVEEAENRIRSAIKKATKAEKKLKFLGETSGNCRDVGIAN